MTCDIILVSLHLLLGCLTNLEPRHAYPVPVGSTKDNPSCLLSEGGKSMTTGYIYLTGANVNDMLNTFESGGRSKQVHDMCGHGRYFM